MFGPGGLRPQSRNALNSIKEHNRNIHKFQRDNFTPPRPQSPWDRGPPGPLLFLRFTVTITPQSQLQRNNPNHFVAAHLDHLSYTS